MRPPIRAELYRLIHARSTWVVALLPSLVAAIRIAGQRSVDRVEQLQGVPAGAALELETTGFGPMADGLRTGSTVLTLLLFVVIPLSVIAITLGCRQHKSWVVAQTSLAGLAILIFAAIYGHDVLGHDGERVATIIGASIIALGHIRNYQLCRRAKCAC